MPVKVKVKQNGIAKLKKFLQEGGHLFVGYTERHKYDAIDKPFYAAVGRKISITGERFGKPRRFGVTKEKSAFQVASYNEYGGWNRPPRPFIAKCVRENEQDWKKFVIKKAKNAQSMASILWSLGPKVKMDLSDTVKKFSTPPNAPSTIKMKGFNNPLVDSGNMSEAFIDVEVNGSYEV